MVRGKAIALLFLILTSCVTSQVFEKHKEETMLELHKLKEDVQKIKEWLEDFKSEEWQVRERIAELAGNFEALEDDLRSQIGEVERKVHFIEMSLERIQEEIAEIKRLLGEEHLFFKGKMAFEEKECEKLSSALKEYKTSYPDGKYTGNLYFMYGKCLEDSQNKEEALKIYISFLKEYPASEKFCEVLERSIEILKSLNRTKELSAFEKEKKMKCPPAKFER